MIYPFPRQNAREYRNASASGTMLGERLELSRVSPHGPEPCASTNSAIRAKEKLNGDGGIFYDTWPEWQERRHRLGSSSPSREGRVQEKRPRYGI
jgi:hypothetical protein